MIRHQHESIWHIYIHNEINTDNALSQIIVPISVALINQLFLHYAHVNTAPLGQFRHTVHNVLQYCLLHRNNKCKTYSDIEVIKDCPYFDLLRSHEMSVANIVNNKL